MLRRRSESSLGLIGTRIQLLTSHKRVDDKHSSPTLADLREKKSNRVTKFLQIFESKPWREKVGVNWWVDGISPLALNIKPVFEFPRVAPELNEAEFLKELLKLEESHIRAVSKSIYQSKQMIKDNQGYIAMKLRENDVCLLGEMLAFKELHKMVIRPEIFRETLNGKCIDVIKFLIKLLDDGELNCYVRQNMLKRSIEKLHQEYLYLLQERRSDKYETSKILESYHEWVSKVGDELMKHPTENADGIALCLDCEMKLKALLRTIDEAESVSRISQIKDNPLEVYFKVFEILKKRDEVKRPMLLLVPRKNKIYGYRYPINVLQLGNFVKSFELQMISKEFGYANQSRFFLFECCVIYTTVVQDTFSYENHFWIKDVKFYSLDDGRHIADLVNCDHSLSIDNPEMIEILQELHEKHRFDENLAEINMTEKELFNIVESVSDVKKWRRYSVVPLPIE